MQVGADCEGFGLAMPHKRSLLSNRSSASSICVRGPGAGRDEVDDEPGKPTVRYPSPHLIELSEDAVPPLGIRRVPHSDRPRFPAFAGIA